MHKIDIFNHEIVLIHDILEELVPPGSGPRRRRAGWILPLIGGVYRVMLLLDFVAGVLGSAGGAAVIDQ